jgi:hypothetical protein
MAPRYRHPIGPIPTLGQLRRNTPWLWVYCTAGIRQNCFHKAPMALAPLIIRWAQMPLARTATAGALEM